MLEALSGRPVPAYPVRLTRYRQIISPEKDAEFPNGKPLMVYETMQMLTDAAGRYRFQFTVHPNSAFFATIPKGNYCQTSGQMAGVALTDDMKPQRDYLRTVYDTIRVEKAAYIRYHIRHTTGFENEQLYLKTPYGSPSMRPDKIGPRLFDSYNILLFGRTDQFIHDTVPGESKPMLAVEWLHYLTDTIQYRLDSIPVAPGALSTFTIHY